MNFLWLASLIPLATSALIVRHRRDSWQEERIQRLRRALSQDHGIDVAQFLGWGHELADGGRLIFSADDMGRRRAHWAQLFLRWRFPQTLSTLITDNSFLPTVVMAHIFARYIQQYCSKTAADMQGEREHIEELMARPPAK